VALGCEMALEALKDVSIGAAVLRRCLGGSQKGGTAVDARIADESGVAGNHVLDVARRLMTELAAPLGNEQLGHVRRVASVRPTR
jgi:hypothetical protein